MNRHTPAPWAPFILDMPLTDIPAYVDKCMSASNGTDFYFVAGKDERGDVDVAHIGNGPRAAENARLIAAAPELLEALKGVVRVADRATQEFDAARAAIAKAEGKA